MVRPLLLLLFLLAPGGLSEPRPTRAPEGNATASHPRAAAEPPAEGAHAPSTTVELLLGLGDQLRQVRSELASQRAELILLRQSAAASRQRVPGPLPSRPPANRTTVQRAEKATAATATRALAWSIPAVYAFARLMAAPHMNAPASAAPSTALLRQRPGLPSKHQLTLLTMSALDPRPGSAPAPGGAPAPNHGEVTKRLVASRSFLGSLMAAGKDEDEAAAVCETAASKAISWTFYAFALVGVPFLAALLDVILEKLAVSEGSGWKYDLYRRAVFSALNAVFVMAFAWAYTAYDCANFTGAIAGCNTRELGTWRLRALES